MYAPESEHVGGVAAAHADRVHLEHAFRGHRAAARDGRRGARARRVRRTARRSARFPSQRPQPRLARRARAGAACRSGQGHSRAAGASRRRSLRVHPSRRSEVRAPPRQSRSAFWIQGELACRDARVSPSRRLAPAPSPTGAQLRPASAADDTSGLRGGDGCLYPRPPRRDGVPAGRKRQAAYRARPLWGGLLLTAALHRHAGVSEPGRPDRWRRSPAASGSGSSSTRWESS